LHQIILILTLCKNKQSLEHPIILAIESSCDDTSAAVITGQKILSNKTYNQTIHEKYGGVVPEVASRSHQEKILPVVMDALNEAGLTMSHLDAVGYTRGPGLIGSLMVGVSFAKSLAYGLNIPTIEVHHMQAHILAHMIDEPRPNFPFLCLTVSGGHTQIVLVHSPYHMEILGKTIDDAAGEAFDKSGKLLGLPYPAGPHVDKLAVTGEVKFKFAKPKIEGLDFSFSGLKTSILYFLQKEIKQDPAFIEKELPHICASIQQSIVDILLDRLAEAAQAHQITEVSIAGGVSANSGLRQGFLKLAEQKGWNAYIPQFQYCTDNAGMIAIAAYYKYLKGEFGTIDAAADARLPWEMA